MSISVQKEVRYVVTGLPGGKKVECATEMQAVELAVGHLIESEVKTGQSHVLGPVIVRLRDQLMPLLAKASHPKNESKSEK